MWVQQSQQKAVGDALAAARERAGVTQAELARRLRKPQSFVSNYERGQRRIDVLELVRITQTLGVDPAKVFAEVLARHMGRRSK